MSDYRDQGQPLPPRDTAAQRASYAGKPASGGMMKWVWIALAVIALIVVLSFTFGGGDETAPVATPAIDDPAATTAPADPALEAPATTPAAPEPAN